MRFVSKFKQLIIAAMTLSIMSSAVTYAATIIGPKDYYNEIWTNSKVIAGDTIDAGKYALFNRSDRSLAEYSIKDGTHTLINDTFSYNAIVSLKDGDTLYMSNCYAVKLSEARIQPVDSCMVIVGDQIPAGRYSAEYWGGKNLKGTLTIWDTIDLHVDEEELNEESKTLYDGSDYSVELKEGQVVKLEGARLTDR